MTNLPETLDNLRIRGLIQDSTDLSNLSCLPIGTSFYLGIDPTSPFLGIGNLVPLITAFHLAKAGLRPIFLLGGATGSVGDPSGKKQERPLLSTEEIELNVASHRNKIQELSSRLNIAPEFVNNSDWTAPLTLIEFLREVGKYLTVNYMLAKDSVKSRLETSGLSFTEFSYMLLQANDYLYLYQKYDCKLQIGGADQWGNITAGLELIRKKVSGNAHALSVPLLTNRNGVKFGKSESGNIFINEQATSPYQLYQFFLNTPDDDVERLLKIFTFLTIQEITSLVKEGQQNPDARIAQRKLAEEIVKLVHGQIIKIEAQSNNSVLYTNTLISPNTLIELLSSNALEGIPKSELKLSEMDNFSIGDAFTKVGLTSSKAEAKRLASSGGLSINHNRITDTQALLKNIINLTHANSDMLPMLLRVGKKQYHLIKFIK